MDHLGLEISVLVVVNKVVEAGNVFFHRECPVWKLLEHSTPLGEKTEDHGAKALSSGSVQVILKVGRDRKTLKLKVSDVLLTKLLCTDDIWCHM